VRPQDSSRWSRRSSVSINKCVHHSVVSERGSTTEAGSIAGAVNSGSGTRSQVPRRAVVAGFGIGGNAAQAVVERTSLQLARLQLQSPAIGPRPTALSWAEDDDGGGRGLARGPLNCLESPLSGWTYRVPGTDWWRRGLSNNDRRLAVPIVPTGRDDLIAGIDYCQATPSSLAMIMRVRAELSRGLSSSPLGPMGRRRIPGRGTIVRRWARILSRSGPKSSGPRNRRNERCVARWPRDLWNVEPPARSSHHQRSRSSAGLVWHVATDRSVLRVESPRAMATAMD